MKVLTRPQPKTQPPLDTPALIGVVRRQNRQQRYFNAALLLGVIAVFIAASVLWERSTRQSDAITQLVGSLSDVCDQTNQGTLPLDVREDCTRAEAGQPPAIVEGIPGTPGTDGAAGRPGAPGGPGAPGQSPECLSTPERCQGAEGQPGGRGTDGRNGIDGQPGQSPPCLNTPAMCQGTDGTNGVNGTNGEPPLGWSTARADGSVETCERAAAFDAANPRYACAITTPPEDDGGLLGP